MPLLHVAAAAPRVPVEPEWKRCLGNVDDGSGTGTNVRCENTAPINNDYCRSCCRTWTAQRGANQRDLPFFLPCGIVLAANSSQNGMHLQILFAGPGKKFRLPTVSEVRASVLQQSFEFLT